MTQAMAEELPEARRLDPVARRRVDSRAGSARPDCVQSGQLRIETHLVCALQLVRQGPGGEGAGAVRAIAVDHAACVDEHELARFHPALARKRMWLGRVRARGDVDGERHAVRVPVVEELLHAPGEIALGLTDEPTLVRQALEGVVPDLGGAPDRVQLVFVLDGAQLLDEAVARDGLDAAGMEPCIALEGDGRGLEADGARKELGECQVEIALGLDELDAVDRASALGIPKVGEEPDTILLDEERRIRALQAGEVAHIGRIRDEQRLLELFAQAIDSIVHDDSAR